MIDTSRRELLSSVAKALPLAAVATVAAEPAFAAPKGNGSATTLLSNFAPGVGGFSGTLTVTRFDVVNGVLSAVADLTGDVLSPTGGIVGPASQSLTLPVQVSASCTILTLTLGPLDLNLLGLMVHLNQVVLNITAVPGAGNLLGNLLCAVANLLNGGGPLATLLTNLVSVLNNILGAL
jgi:hypothetical protein